MGVGGGVGLELELELRLGLLSGLVLEVGKRVPSERGRERETVSESWAAASSQPGTIDDTHAPPRKKRISLCSRETRFRQRVESIRRESVEETTHFDTVLLSTVPSRADTVHYITCCNLPSVPCYRPEQSSGRCSAVTSAIRPGTSVVLR